LKRRIKEAAECGMSHSTITYFKPDRGFKTPPLSVAARVGDLLFVSGTPG
jgi:hypothetical protein